MHLRKAKSLGLALALMVTGVSFSETLAMWVSLFVGINFVGIARTSDIPTNLPTTIRGYQQTRLDLFGRRTHKKTRCYAGLWTALDVAELLFGARSRNRTGMVVLANRRILSPLRLPISPFGQSVDDSV
jgi:hypothetical protein